MKKNTVALLAAASLSVAGTAQASIIWDWTLSSPGVGGGNQTDYGSGTFTTTSEGSYSGVEGYQLITADGSFDGITVTGVPTLDAALAAGWNQLLLPSDATPAGAPVDGNGIALTINSGSTPYAGLYSTGAGGDYGANTVVSGTMDDLDSPGDNFSDLQLTVTPTPEPSQVVSMLGLAGLGAVSLLARRRRRK